jgi:hypothetical protein
LSAVAPESRCADGDCARFGGTFARFNVVHCVNACTVGRDELTQRTGAKNEKKKKKKKIKKKKKKKKKKRFAVTFCNRRVACDREAKANATIPTQTINTKNKTSNHKSQIHKHSTVCKSSNTNVSKFAFGISKQKN